MTDRPLLSLVVNDLSYPIPLSYFTSHIFIDCFLFLKTFVNILVVNDWNRNVIQFAGSITEYLNADSVLTLINKQFQPKYDTNGASVAGPDRPRTGSTNESVSSKGMERAPSDTTIDIF